MKSKTRLSMITSLVAAMFILSMFSGVIAAQTPAEQYEKAREQYLQKKNKYENTQQKLNEAREQFDEAYKRLINLKDDKSKDELKTKTKEYLLRAIDHTVSHLEVLKTRVGQDEDKGIIPFNASAIIDAHLKELEQIRTNVEAAKTNQDFVAAHRQLKDLWEKIRLETRYYVGIVLNNRIDRFITKTDNVTTKMEAAINKLKGKDTSKLVTDEASFTQLVTEARANQARTVELFKAHNGFVDGIVTNASSARDFLKQGDASQRATIKNLKDASKAVLKFVRDFKEISRGEVKIEGTMTSTLSGN